MTTCDFLMSNRRYSARSRQWHFNLNLWWKLRKRGVPLGKRTRWFKTFFWCYLCVCCLWATTAAKRDHVDIECVVQSLETSFSRKVRKRLSYLNKSQFDSEPDSAGTFFVFFSLAGSTHHHTLTMSYLSEWVTWIKKPQREEETRKKVFK